MEAVPHTAAPNKLKDGGGKTVGFHWTYTVNGHNHEWMWVAGHGTVLDFHYPHDGTFVVWEGRKLEFTDSAKCASMREAIKDMVRDAFGCPI
jgi:hypothetical protein